MLEAARISVGRIDKLAGAKFRPELASEVIKEAFKLARTAVSKNVTSASTSMETMVLYAQSFVDGLPHAFKAMDKSIKAAKSLDGLAGILAGIQTMTDTKFDSEYRAETKKFEKQVLPTLLKTNATAGGAVSSSRNAKIKIGSKVFRAQVFEYTAPFAGTTYRFMTWIEFPVDENPKKGRPLELSADQVKLPPEPPPPTAAIGAEADGPAQ